MSECLNFSSKARLTFKLMAAWLLTLVCVYTAAEEPLRVAVAANFRTSAEAIATRFEQRGGGPISLQYASTGVLYAQILHGAPFDVFLAADSQRPAALESRGLAVAGSRFTYALGRLALVTHSPKAGLRDLRRLAIANPDTAPYGAAAMAYLQKMGADEALTLVRGNNVTQALQMWETRNTDGALVSLAQVLDREYELIPSSVHSPIAQQAVLLSRAKENASARAFHLYLSSAEARDLIAAGGYQLPESAQ